MRVKGEEAQLLRLLISHRASQSMSVVSHCLGTWGASHTKTSAANRRLEKHRAEGTLLSFSQGELWLEARK